MVPRIALFLLTATQIVWSATAVDTYIQQVNSLVTSHRSSISRLTSPANVTAAALTSGGSIYLGNNGDAATFYEMSGRSGGLMQMLQFISPSGMRSGDVLWITYTSKSYANAMTTAAAVHQIGGIVVSFGPQVPSGFTTPPNWVDSLTPWTSTDDDFTLLGNVLSMWSLTGELASNTARRGKTLVFWQSISVPGAQTRNAHYSGTLFHTGIPQMSSAVQAGTLSASYLDYVSAMLTRIQATEVLMLLATGQTLGQRLASANPVSLLTSSHIIPFVPSLPNPYMLYVSDISLLPASLARTGYLLYLGYAGVDLEAWRNVRSQPGANATWVQSKIPAQADFTYFGDLVANQQWDYGDCTVNVPGYDVCILPASGIAQLFMYEIVLKAAETNTSGPPSLTVLSGSGQSASSVFAQTLQAKLLDSGGNAIANANVVFTAPTTGPSVSWSGSASLIAITNAQGIATAPQPTGNGIAGSFTVSATSSGVLTPAQFSLVNLAGPPASIAALSGTPQTTVVNTQFALPFQVSVKDANNNPVPNTLVTFAAPTAGPSCLFNGNSVTSTATTNASGVASSALCTANSVPGASYQVSATVTAQVSTAFTLTNNAAAAVPTQLFPVAGTPQNVVAGASAVAFQAKLVDTSQSPIPGVTVTFTAPSSGPSGTFAGSSVTANAVTNAQGIATAPTFTANVVAGSYFVNATVSGLTAAFSITNVPATTSGPALFVLSGANQSTLVGYHAFTTPVIVKLIDALGLGVSGAQVTFRSPPSGASVFMTGGVGTLVVTTDANGVAGPGTLVSNSVAGSYVLTADVNGFHLNIPLTNANTAQPTLVATTTTNQSAVVGTVFSPGFQVKLSDGSGNPISNTTVNFTVTSTSSQPSGYFPGGLSSVAVLTDSQGLATAPIFTANSTSGSYSLSATALASGAALSFFLTNTPADPHTPTQLLATFSYFTNVNTLYPGLQVRLTDSLSSPIAGATVVFTAPPTGASGTFSGGATTASSLTDTNGYATAPAFTANAFSGSFKVTASSGGLSAFIACTNVFVASPGASLQIVSGANQSAQSGYHNFAAPIILRLIGADSLPAVGVSVVFRSPGGGPSLFFPYGLGTQVVTTDANGMVSSGTITTNQSSGSYTISVDANGLHLDVPMTNTP